MLRLLLPFNAPNRLSAAPTRIDPASAAEAAGAEHKASSDSDGVHYRLFTTPLSTAAPFCKTLGSRFKKEIKSASLPRPKCVCNRDTCHFMGSIWENNGWLPEAHNFSPFFMGDFFFFYCERPHFARIAAASTGIAGAGSPPRAATRSRLRGSAGHNKTTPPCTGKTVRRAPIAAALRGREGAMVLFA